MTVIKTKSQDTFAEFQTMHFMNGGTMACSMRFEGDYFEDDGNDWKVPGVVMER